MAIPPAAFLPAAHLFSGSLRTDSYCWYSAWKCIEKLPPPMTSAWNPGYVWFSPSPCIGTSRTNPCYFAFPIAVSSSSVPKAPMTASSNSAWNCNPPRLSFSISSRTFLTQLYSCERDDTVCSLLSRVTTVSLLTYPVCRARAEFCLRWVSQGHATRKLFKHPLFSSICPLNAC